MANYKSSRSRIHLLFWILAFVMLYLFPDISNAWEIERSRDGIEVQTRKTQGIEFKEFRGVTIINASLNSIVALIHDVESYPSWYYNCKEAKSLKKVSSAEGFNYTITETPWPTDDRDSIIHYKRTQDAETKNVTILLIGVADYIQAESDLVRIQKLEGHWKLSPLSVNKVEVTLQMFADPGGNIPAWLANAMVVDMPYHSLMNMKKEVLNPKYKNATGLVEELN